MNIIVMVTLRGQQKTHKLSVSPQQTLTLGRGWNNDVVIPDDYVDATHIALTVDDTGQLHIKDLCTQNGTLVNKRRLSNTTRYQPGTRILLGDATCSIVNADSHVLPAIKRNLIHRLTRRFDSIFGILIATGLLIGAVLADAYALSADEFTGDSVFSLFVEIGTSMLMWCIAAGIVGKLFVHRMQFASHWVFLCLLFCATTAFSFLLGVVMFNLNPASAHLWYERLLYGPMIIVLIFGGLSLATPISTLKKVGIACLLTLAPMIYSIASPLIQKEHETWSHSASINVINKPPTLLRAKPISIDEHLQRSDHLFARLDREVQGSAAHDVKPDNLTPTYIENIDSQSIELSDNQ